MSTASPSPSPNLKNLCRPRFARPLHVAAAALGLAALTTGSVARATDYSLTVDASKPASDNPHFWSTCVGTGTASLTLRSDLQTHYQIANRELGMQRVRGHGVLNDDMGIYKGAGSYDFSKFDSYLAAIAAANMRPIMELSFMPTSLAASGNNKNPPKDYAAYTALIQAVVQHAVDKFGAEDVAKWYWEVWNEPNYSGFWTGTFDDYLKLYDAAVAGATAALPNIIIGGPATTQGSTSQMTTFINHVKSGNIRFNFISSHAYAGGAAETAPADFGLTDNNGRVGVITTAGYTTDMIKSLNTEFNSSYSGQGGNMAGNCVSMDTHVNAPFIVKTVKLLSDKDSGSKPPLDVFSYWTVSDVFDESSGPSGSYILSKTPNGTLPFGQVFGLLTFQGMRKAAFNGFKMLNYLGDKRLVAAGGTGTKDGVDAMAAANADGSEVQIIVYNYYSTIATSGTDNVTINVSNLPFAGKDGYITRFAIDESHTNPYSVWSAANKPSAPSEAQWEDMHKVQHLMPVDPITKQKFDTSYMATFAIPKQGASLIILGTKRPLTGRNALLPIEGEDFDGQSGITKEDSGDTSLGQSVSVAANGYEYFESVDYTDGGVDTVELRVKTAAATTLELHAETQTGTLVGSCALPSTSNAWATQTCKLAQPVTGVAKLYLVFGGAAHLNWLKFSGAGNPTTGTGGMGGVGGTSGTGATGAGAAAGAPNTGGVSALGGSGGVTSGGSAGVPVGAGGVTTAAGGGAGQSSSAGGTTSTGGTSSGGGNPAGGSAGSAVGAGGVNSTGSGGSGQGNATSGGSSSKPSSGDSSGCGCRVADNERHGGSLAVFGLLLGFGALRKRRAQGRGGASARARVATGSTTGPLCRAMLTWASWVGVASLAAACSSKDEPSNPGTGGNGCANGACAGQVGTSTGGATGSGGTTGTGSGGVVGSGGSAGTGVVGSGGSLAGQSNGGSAGTGTGGTSGAAGTPVSAGGSGGTAGTAPNGGAGASMMTAGTGGASGMPGSGGMSGASGAAPTLTLPYLVTSGPSAYWKVDGTLTQSTSATADVTVNDTSVAQTWEGFGAAFNELGWKYLSMLDETQRNKALDLLFSANGANFAWGRIPMGATDYAIDRYTCDETAGDTALASFSLMRDEQSLMAYVKAAKAVKSDLRFWSSPWTPPTWLKDGPFNDDYPFDGGKMKTDATSLKALADYFVKFVQGYGQEGITIEIVSPQNEPGYSGTYPTCGWAPATYADFVGKYLGPALSTAGLSTKIMLGTFNGGTGDTDIVSAVMGDATAKGFIKVLGYQWGMDAQVASAKAYNLPIWQTEHKCGNYPWMTYDKNKAPNDQAYAVESWGLIRDWIKKGVTAYSAWNAVLDTIGNGIDATRVWPQDALLAIDTTAKTLIVTPAFHVFRHFSQFVAPGAKVIGTTGGDAIAFKNPDGSVVTVLYNSGAEKMMTVSALGKKLQFTAPATGWATVVTN